MRPLKRELSFATLVQPGGNSTPDLCTGSCLCRTRGRNIGKLEQAKLLYMLCLYYALNELPVVSNTLKS